MKKFSKILVIAAAVLAIIAGSVFATLAYLTDRESVANTFTVGNVDITLDETDVDNNGKPIEGADRVTKNDYHLLPGMSYVKDPTVTVNKGSDESYVRIIMTVHNASAVQALIDGNGLTDFADLIEGWDAETWVYNGFTTDDDANTISFEFRYHETVTALTDEEVLDPLFDYIVVPGTATNEQLAALYGSADTTDDDFRMVLEGHAIQAATFDTADDAWEAFETQWGSETTAPNT